MADITQNIPTNWELLKIRDIALVRSGNTPSRAMEDRYFNNGVFPWVKTMDLNNGYIFLTDEKITQFAIEETSCPILDEGTVLVAMYGGFNQIGRTGLLKIKASINQAISALSINREMAEPEFVLNWLNANVDLWREFAASSRKDPNITRNDVQAFPILLPSLEEQRKIAAILSTWDEAIGLVEQLIGALGRRRQALMQLLLTGAVRFAGFEGEWEEKNFDSLFYTISSKKYQAFKSTYLESGKYAVVDQGQQFIVGYSDNDNPFMDIPVIVFGDHTRILKWVNFPFVVGADGTKLLKTYDICDLRFGYYLLENLELPNLGYSRHFSVLKENNFIIPKKMDEQDDIAEVLAACDEQIKLIHLQGNQLREQKRGLMQQLLTGQVRV